MAEVPVTIAIVYLSCKETDSGCQLCSAIHILIAGVCEAEGARGCGAIAEERAVMSTELCYIGVGSGA